MTRNPLPPGSPLPQTPALPIGYTHAEDWLWSRLQQLSCPLYAGDYPTLKDRIRAVITREGLEMVIAGRCGTKAETFQDAFERLFGEPLQPRQSNSRQKATR